MPWGRSRLANEYAKYPDLEKHFIRNQLEEVLIQMAQEKAALLHPSDLRDRALGLHQLAASRDPNFVLDFAVVDGQYMERLTARRLDGVDRPPLEVSFELDESKLQKGTIESLRRHIEYGSLEPVHIPQEAIVERRVSHPHLVATPEDFDELVVSSRADLPSTISVEVATIGELGQVRRSVHGKTGRRTQGTQGVTIELILDGGVTLLLTLTSSSRLGKVDGFQIRFDYAMEGFNVRLTRSALDLLTDIEEGYEISFYFNGDFAMKGNAPTGIDLIDPHTAHLARQLMDDLVVIGDACGPSFLYPDVTKMSVHERIMIRISRLLLDGHIVLLPGIGTVSATLHEQNTETLCDFLNNAHSVLVNDHPLLVPIQGRDVLIGKTAWFHPSMRAENATDLLKVSKKGSVEGREAHLKATDDSNMRVFMVDHWPTETMVPTAWDIPDIDEPPCLQAIVESGQTTIPELDL